MFEGNQWSRFIMASILKYACKMVDNWLKIAQNMS